MRLLVRRLLIAAAALLGQAVDPSSAQDVGLMKDRQTGRLFAPQAREAIGPFRENTFLIFNGVPAVWANQVYAIRYLTQGGKESLCTGTLLDTRHVLTAGHCGCGIPASYTLSNAFRAPPRGTGPQANAIRTLGAPIQFDPEACQGGIKYGHDLALIRLEKQIEHIGAEHLHAWTRWWNDIRRYVTANKRLLAVGYGETEAGESGEKMQAEIPVLSPDCSEVTWWPHCAPFAEIVLAEAGGSRARDTCGGDSGGPVLMEAPAPMRSGGEGRSVMLVGVTSRAAPLSQPNAHSQCGGGGIYTLIGRSSVANWLQENGVRFGVGAPLPDPESVKK